MAVHGGDAPLHPVGALGQIFQAREQDPGVLGIHTRIVLVNALALGVEHPDRIELCVHRLAEPKPHLFGGSTRLAPEAGLSRSSLAWASAGEHHTASQKTASIKVSCTLGRVSARTAPPTLTCPITRA